MNKSKEKILVIGSRGHAKVIIDLIELLDKFEITGIIDDFRIKGELVEGYQILGGIKEIPEIASTFGVSSGIIAIGDNWIRNKEFSAIRELDNQFKFITLIHPSANISRSASISEGTVILGGAIINASAQIGKFCIINTKASVDHDCQMDHFSSIAPGVTLGGNSKIGTFSAIGIGAIVKDKITIGEHSVIGAGSLVLKDTESYKIVYGSPARIIRNRSIGESYL